MGSEVEAWIEANWDPDITVREWWARLAGAGYAHPRWPDGLGGHGASSQEARTISAALAKARVVGPPTGHVAANLAAPTLLAHGSEAQIDKFLPEIACGEAAFCQLFSEPGSGSDLASVGTRAEADGDEWIVNGQKVWNSGANSATYGLLLARTDVDVPKHRGMSYFIIDMDQPGIEARPLRQMNGVAAFCEVFLTDARVQADRLIGEPGGGWSVAQTTLAAERAGTVGRAASGLAPAQSGAVGGDLNRTVGEVVERVEHAKSRRIMGGAVPTRLMLQLARDHGVADQSVMRQELVRYYTQNKVNAWTNARIGAARGALTGADGSMAKLATARVCQHSRDLSLAIIGASGMLTGSDAPLDGELAMIGLASPGTRLGGGTDEVQLNVLGERGLGLPREPSDDKDLPYSELRVGTQRPAEAPA